MMAHGDTTAFGRVRTLSINLLWRRWQPLDLIWVLLCLGYVFLAVLIGMGSPTGHTAAPSDGVQRGVQFRIDPTARRSIATLACTASVVSAFNTLGFTSYTKGIKKPPMISAFLFYLLLTCIFAMDATDMLFRPFGIELQNYYVHIVSMFMMYSAFGTLIAMRHGPAIANAELAQPRIYAFYFWGLLLPAPFAFLTIRSGDWAGPLAAVWAGVVLIGYSLTYKAASKRMQQLLSLHWTITANGVLSIVAWAINYFLHFGVSYLHGFSITNARAMYIFTLVFQSTQIGLIILQAVDSFEESARFKTERDAAQAELLVRAEQQRQAKESEEARQKFLRYIFHEIRVPFNSIDMGLSMLMEDLRASQRAQKRSAKSLSPSAAGRRGFDGTVISSTPSSPAQSHLQSGVTMLTTGEVRLPADAVEILETISKASASMKVIINDTLDWTKLQSGAFQVRPSPTDVRKDLHNTMEGLMSFAQHNHVQVLLEMDEDLPEFLLVDSVRLQQVVANYVSNGIKFARTDGQGEVVIRVECVGSGRQKVYKENAAVATRLLGDGQIGKDSQQPLLPFNFEGVWWKENTEDGQLCTSTDHAPRSMHLSASSVNSRLELPASTETPAAVAIDVQKAATGPAFPMPRPVSVGAEFNPCTDLRSVQLDEATLARIAEQGFCPVHGPAEPQTATVIISVKDNGAGVAASEASLLFDAFRQLDAGMQYKGKGTGLGLAICHEIVSLHGGRVGIRSSGRPREGAEFLAALKLFVLHRAPAASGSRLQTPGGSYAVVGGTEPVGFGANADRSSTHPLPIGDKAIRISGTGPATGQVVATMQLETTTSASAPVRKRSSSKALSVDDLDRPCKVAGAAAREAHSSGSSTGGDPSLLSPAASLPGIVDPGHDTGVHCTPSMAADSSSSSLNHLIRRDNADASPLVHRGPAVNAPSSLDPFVSHADVQQKQQQRPLRVLVVDDVADNRKLLRKALCRRLETLLHHLNGQSGWSGRWAGIACDEADDGHIAVETVRQRGAAWYDVITMDAEMPTMSGFIATEKIRQLGYKGLLYGCTGNALEADQQLFAQKGANAVYIKPLDLHGLANDIHERLFGSERVCRS